MSFTPHLLSQSIIIRMLNNTWVHYLLEESAYVVKLY